MISSSSSSPSSSSSFDSEQFKTAQRKSWDSAAPGWKEWWQTLETAAQKVNERLMELAEIKPGQKVLDIATGIGEPAITAARRLASGYGNKSGDNNKKNRGHVLATDISTQMLTIAKQRAAAMGLQDIIEFREADAEMLELADSSFDIVLSRWGLMFMPNLNNTLSRICHALVSGGRLACTVWAEASKVPFISFPMGIVMRELQVSPPPPGTPGPFALSDINILQGALSYAGFTDIHSERFNVTFEFANVEDYVNYTKAVAAPIKNMLSKELVKRQEEVWNILTEQVRNNYTTMNTGHSAAAANRQSVRMNNECICVAAKKP
jgi:ubiquinone/menaquinone biosynthesis C-methylase UbiE